VPKPPKPSREPAVYQALRRAILERALEPGARLPEDVIGEQLGVSRTIVHTALVRLAGDGLVELRPNRGAFVAAPSLDEGRDIFAVRMTLERQVVETLAAQLAPAQAAELEAHIAAEEAAAGHNEPLSIRLAGEFHTLLAGMTGNAMLTRFVAEAVSRTSLILALYARAHSADCAVSEHRALLTALKAGDAAGAAGVMAQHLDAVMTRALPPKSGQRSLKDVLSAYAKEG
jgi:DNA-binding GntR family transcriptional regulator